ncbi:hypothetical protein TRFO_40784 [Tritrichomonas foetus]|uniref:Uncharacterized protein n=1 Tax=Tritrichomonas foetus TaxID=1144522 RepID=A0A1J4J0F6_9EUKA|nr:hypothetical protein TRFO_40784 [Tritrichomonas foetus]|eukprot:OHS92898.1 hypothetical protein TRFO_40784 [Tritrichomonas foetus]
MSPKSLNVYYLHSFYSNFGNLMADDEIEATISLCRKAIAGDEDSSVGLPRNNEIKSLEIERLMYDVLFKFIEFKKDPKKFIKKQQNQSDNQNNENSNENNGVNENNKVNEPNQVNEKYELDENVEFDVKNVVKEVVQLCVELHNREWITHDGLQVFKELGGGLDLINEVLRVDPDAELFNYTPAFVNAVIKSLGYESENAQKERVSHFLIKLPKIVAKPKQIINYALSTNNINLAATVFAEKCHEPIHAMNLFETLGDFQSIVDKVLCLEKNNDFYYVNESSAFRKDVIEWLFTLNKSTFTRLQNSIQISEDKMTNFLLVLLNSDILNSNEEELYLNAILETLSELNIGFNRSIFKIVEQKIIKNCPKKFTRKSIKYLLDSVFSKKEEYLMPDHRETLLCQIVQTVNLPLTLCRKLILYCASFSFDEAEILLLNKLKMYEIIIQKYINEVSQNQNDEDISQENDFKKVYDFIILKYNENDHSMSEIDVALIKNADILASSDPEALINVLYQVNCRILYDSFIEAIKDFETKMVFIYHICIQPFENQKMNRYIVELMPFAAKNFQCECLSILRKYPDGITNPSIVKAFDQFGMYDCCAFAQARLHDHIEARRYIRMLINTLQMPTTYPNNLTEQSFRNEQNNLNDQNSKNSVSAVIYEVCIHLFNLTCFPIETRTQDLHYILKSFALLFTEKENISVATAAYRLVCDAAESFLPFEDILEYSKKIYMNVLDEEKFLRLVRHLMLGRKYNAESAIKLKEFLIQYLAQNTDKENNSDENSSGISKFEEEANELKCGKCHVKLIVEGKGINIFWCGHAVHDIEYCNKAGNCPLCQKAVSLQ